MSYKKLRFNPESVFVITGGAGFIGSHLCDTLINMGYKVKCLDNLSTGSIENIEHLISNENFTFVQGDITNMETCVEVTKGSDYVLHQAAWGSVPRSIEMPVFYNNVNVSGMLNMLEASRLNNVKKFVYASSSSVYGDEKSLPKLEGKEGRVLSPYALTKKIDEDYASLYCDLYGLNTYGLRYFNVFGKRQNPNGAYAAVIPKFLAQMVNNEDVTINGDGSFSRDFTYIENVIDANLKACMASENSAGQVFNIASGGRVDLLSLYNKIAERLNKENTAPIFGNIRRGDIPHSNADVTKAKIELGYEVLYSFDEGLNEYIDWYVNK